MIESAHGAIKGLEMSGYLVQTRKHTGGWQSANSYRVTCSAMIITIGHVSRSFKKWSGGLDAVNDNENMGCEAVETMTLEDER